MKKRNCLQRASGAAPARHAAMAALTALSLSLTSAISFAHEFERGDLMIDHPWARVTHSAAAPAAVYFEMVNNGKADDRLLSASSPRAKAVELHRSERDKDGITRMTVQKDGIVAKAGETTSVETGSYHIMLIGLTKPLADGDKIPLTLTFEKAGVVDVVVNVEDRMSEAPKSSAHDHHN